MRKYDKNFERLHQVNLSILLLAVKGVAKFLSGKLHKAYIRFVPMSENKKS